MHMPMFTKRHKLLHKIWDSVEHIFFDQTKREETLYRHVSSLIMITSLNLIF